MKNYLIYSKRINKYAEVKADCFSNACKLLGWPFTDCIISAPVSADVPVYRPETITVDNLECFSEYNKILKYQCVGDVIAMLMKADVPRINDIKPMIDEKTAVKAIYFGRKSITVVTDTLFELEFKRCNLRNYANKQSRTSNGRFCTSLIF